MCFFYFILIFYNEFKRACLTPFVLSKDLVLDKTLN